MADLLIIDDEPAICVSLRFALEDAHSVRVAQSAAEALAAVEQRPPDVALLDVRLGDVDGLALLPQLRAKSPGTVVIMMTAFGSIRSSVECMQAGAFHYITKPVDVAELQALVARGAEMARLSRRVADLTDEVAGIYGVEGIRGRSPAMRRVWDLVDRVRGIDSTVLISGESGTGKELVARAIHMTGSRRSGPFEVVNCAAIPEYLLESELFGYERGAFTGATRAQRGRFERADGGTLFLDEVGDLPLALQPKLLRVLQDRVVQPLGGGEGRRVDARIVAASNQDLRRLVEAGRWREDLYFRLNVIPIEVPPLRERREDLPELAVFFLARIGQRIGRSCRLGPEALTALQGYAFPGNVRELQNLLERAAVLAISDPIGLADLPAEARGEGGGGTGPGLRVAVGEPLAAVERRLIFATLEYCQGNRRQAAQRLGISERALRYKLAEYRAAGRS